MIAVAQRIDWRVGQVRLLLWAAIHGAALIAGVEIALDWSAAWVFVAIATLSAIADAVRWHGERCEPNGLVLIPGGIAIDGHAYRAKRAWLGPGWTAVWLSTTSRRRLMYVMRDEVSRADHAALRRHVKAIEFL